LNINDRATGNGGDRQTAQERLTLYDAAYLELALRADVPLATLDQQLAAAARAARVPLLGEGDLR
jgi:hypothetical protein